MFIQDSHRSYRAYSYAGLILITDLFLVGTPVGVTELILILRSLHLFGGTRRYNKSKLIIIVSHTESDQTYTDTYQV